MDRATTLAASVAEQLRGWYAHSPTAQRAYARLHADVVLVRERAEPTVSKFWARVGPLIDPPAKGPDAGT
ncbi:MAG: hypothetical protein IT429_23915, partial [Gemmataceae bacterium]|nr:hypothetical protein [Gemmataceae bacterium]